MKPRESTENLLRNIDQISAEFDHFSTYNLEDKEPLTNGDEGLKDLKIIEALYESIRLNTLVKAES